MAVTAFADIQAALEQRIRNRIQTQYNRPDVAANLIRKEMGRGKNIAWDITVGTDVGQVWDDGQEITTFQTDTELPCTLPWSQYGDAWKITGLAEDVAAGSETELAQLWNRRLMQGREKTATKVNTDIYTGDGTAAPRKLLGLTTTAGPLDSTGTYAGQSRVTYTQWQGNVFGNGGIPRAISKNLIQTTLRVAGDASGEQPDFGLTNSTIWQMLGQIESVEVRQEVYIRGEKLVRSYGFEAIEFNGIPIFKDPGAPSGFLLLLNSRHLAIQFLPPAQSRIERGRIIARVPISGTPQEQNLDLGKAPPEANVPLVASLVRLPAQGTYDAYALETTLGIYTDRCNSHILIKDIQQ